VLKLGVECSIFGSSQSLADSPLAKSARLHGAGGLERIFRGRLLAGVLGGVLLPLALMSPGASLLGLAALIFIICLAGELAERHLYFVAEAARKMPGGI